MRYTTPFFGFVIGLICWLFIVWMFATPVANITAEVIGKYSVPKAKILPNLNRQKIWEKIRMVREKTVRR